MSQNTKALTGKGTPGIWAGDFGLEYQVRNASSWPSIKNRARLFGDIFQAMENANKANPSPQPFPASVIEVGGGCGDNLRAIDMIYERSRQPIQLMSCDPNETARKWMSDVATVQPGDLSALPYTDNAADLVFTSGVLIHVPPSDLPRALSERSTEYRSDGYYRSNITTTSRKKSNIAANLGCYGAVIGVRRG